MLAPAWLGLKLSPSIKLIFNILNHRASVQNVLSNLEDAPKKTSRPRIPHWTFGRILEEDLRGSTLLRIWSSSKLNRSITLGNSSNIFATHQRTYHIAQGSGTRSSSTGTFASALFHRVPFQQPAHRVDNFVKLSQGQGLKFLIELADMEWADFLQKARKISDSGRSHTIIGERALDWRPGNWYGCGLSEVSC